MRQSWNYPDYTFIGKCATFVRSAELYAMKQWASSTLTVNGFISQEMSSADLASRVNIYFDLTVIFSTY